MTNSAARPETWLRVTPAGLYCEPGGFHIDPTRPVARAVITHGHGDHARPGNEHVLGSAQLVIEYQGSRVVISGDYKRRPDPTCPPFEPQPCDLFITEATFA